MLNSIGGIINVKGAAPINDTSVLLIDDDGDLSTTIDNVTNFVGK